MFARTRHHRAASLLFATLTLISPFAILICDWRWELAAAAACVSAFLLPGLLLAQLWFRTDHPLAALPGRFATALLLALLLFGTLAAIAAKLHWTLPAFLTVYAVAYLSASGVLAAALFKRTRPLGGVNEQPAASGPALRFDWQAAIVVLAGAGVVMASAALGFQQTDRPWWRWCSVGIAGGIAAMAAFFILPWIAGRRRSQSSSADRQDPATNVAASDSMQERVWAAMLWLLVALATAHLMKAAYENPKWNLDDVTYVSQAVDFLTAEPMDRYEPSLGERIPMDPGFVLPTVTLWAATISWTTGVSCAALMHAALPPFFVFAAVASLAAVLTVVLGRQRVLVPLGLALILAVLIKGVDAHRSYVNFLVFWPSQPKSVHLNVVLPIQLAALLLCLTDPNRRHTLFAAACALAGHLVHPWSTVVYLFWSVTLAAASLFVNRRAAGRLLVVIAVTGAIGGLHQLGAKLDPFGAGKSKAVTPTLIMDLKQTPDGPRPVLDPAITVGGYSFLRFAILTIPFAFILGVQRRAFLLAGLLSSAAVALAFIEQLGVLQAKVIPISLLWRTRWMITAPLNIAALGVCLYGAVTVLCRLTSVTRPAACSLGLLAVLGATAGLLAAGPSGFVKRGGPVVRLTKFSEQTHEIAAALGGLEADPYLLAPPPGRGTRLAGELCQLLPRIRLIVSRALTVEWFLGSQRTKQRLDLLRSFYSGRMTTRQFEHMRERFPVDHAIVDHRQGSGKAQARLLSSLGWTRIERFGRLELWRARE